jgi:hypothetical protein
MMNELVLSQTPWDGEPDHYKFGGGVSETLLHPLVLVAMLVCVAMMFCLKRRQTLVVFLLSTFLIPAGQQLVVGGVHFFVFRIIILAGLIRMAWIKFSGKKRILAGPWNSVDTAVSLAFVLHAIAFTLLYAETAAVVNQVGLIWDSLGAYFFLRFAIRNEEDVVSAIRCFLGLVVLFAILMTSEQFTDKNVFGLLGGVPLIDEIRNGRIRSEAVFQHAILAGTFGATLLPLFVVPWTRTKSKLALVGGVCASTIMTVTTACSTPLLGYGAGILGLFLWPLRRSTRWMRWGIVLGLVALSLIMRAPIWYVIAHVGVVSGSSTEHRAYLVDTFVRHFGEWWLLGTKSNGSWGYETFDTSNQYVQQGVTGGLFALVFLILTISRAFGRVGRARRSVDGADRKTEWLVWLLGCSLFAHTVAFFGISYFDQTRVSWLALLAMICAATKPRPAVAAVTIRQPPDVADIGLDEVESACSADSQCTNGKQRQVIGAEPNRSIWI